MARWPPSAPSSEKNSLSWLSIELNLTYKRIFNVAVFYMERQRGLEELQEDGPNLGSKNLLCMIIWFLLLPGSEDHTLRVFRVEDGVGVYTLHGHCGPITAVFIDRFNHSGIYTTNYLLSQGHIFSRISKRNLQNIVTYFRILFP